MTERHAMTPNGTPETGADDEVLHITPAEKTSRLSRVGRAAVQIMWPAFLGAGAAVGVFFSAIDPLEIELVGVHLSDSREGAYTVGFFLFWLLFMVSGTITWLLANTDHERP